jgi:putative membrane protein
MNTTETQPPKRSLKDYAGLTLRGFAMGSADVVPGVSGGTMAFITGIYEELINSIRGFASVNAVKLLTSFKFKQAYEELPWRFLVAVGLGILLAIITLAQALEWTLENQPVLLWSFFFGLVLASVFTVSKRVKRWGANRIAGTVIGAVVAWVIVGLVPLETPNTWWFLFLSGALAICAMILPGISGAFILVLLGKYEYVLSAVNNRDFVTIAIIGAGAVVGLVTFAQLLGWLFKRYHDVTVAVLMGFMIGSLRKIWPWKIIEVVDGHEVSFTNILPEAWTTEVTLALILAIVGFSVVLVLDYVASHKGKDEEKEIIQAEETAIE